MAQKRALIGTTLIAVNASEFFTQDLEDMAANRSHAQDSEPVNNTVHVRAGARATDVTRVQPTRTAEVKDTPATGPISGPAPREDEKLRDKRAQAIAAMQLVTREGDVFKVQSPSVVGKKKIFEVSRNDSGKVICTCEEFEQEVASDIHYRCEHILAVKHSLMQKPAEAAPVATAQPAQPLTPEELEMELLTPSDRENDKRAKGIVSLGNVTQIEEGFTVTMPGFKDQQQSFVVCRDGAGTPCCNCSEFDQQHNQNEDDSYRCVHMMAVRYFLQQPAPAEQPARAPEQPKQPGMPRDPLAKSMADLVTPKQIGMMKALAREAGVNHETECQNVLRCTPEELSKKGASSFIDHLKNLAQEVTGKGH